MDTTGFSNSGRGRLTAEFLCGHIENGVPGIQVQQALKFLNLINNSNPTSPTPSHVMGYGFSGNVFKPGTDGYKYGKCVHATST
jgi:hypothetical protein